MEKYTRDTAPVSSTWRLEDIFQTDEKWEECFAEAVKAIPRLQKYRQLVNENNMLLIEYLDFKSATFINIEKLYGYAHMRRDENNGNSLYQGMTSRAYELYVNAGAATSWAAPAIQAMAESAINAIKSNPAAADYVFYIENTLRAKPHTLPTEQEHLLAQLREAFAAPNNAYSMLTNADMRYNDITMPDGSVQQVTDANLISLLNHRERSVRHDTFMAMMSAYAAFENTLAATYSANVKNDVVAARIARHGSALSASLFEDAIPESVYTSLIEAMHDNIPSLDKYINLRKRALNLPDIHMYDLYVNMVSDFDIDVSYEEAREIVLEGLRPLGEEYVSTLRNGLENRWVDVYPGKGKTSGAYCWSVYGLHPYMLLNYDAGVDEIFTLAHEAGHAMHAHYTMAHQPYALSDTSIFICEVASTVNEVLLVYHLMDKYSDNKSAQAFLINYLLEQFRTTVFRQTLFAEFEKRTHEMAESGEALTSDSLGDEYLRICQKYYGGAAVVDTEIRNEWLRIPHFYRSFYVFQYATGFSAAVAIAHRIRTLGAPAVEDYIAFLSAGGNGHPIDVLRLAGVDMSTKEPVEQALKLFGEMVDRLAEII